MLFDKVPLHEYFVNILKFEIESNAENPDYRCLRSLLHVVNATKVLIWMEFLIMALYVLFAFPYCLAWIGFHLALILVTIYAIKQEKQRFLWPFIIFAGIQFVVWAVISMIKFFIGIFNPDQFLEWYGQGHHEDIFVRWAIIIAIKIIALSFLAFLFWRLTVVYTTRKYYEAKEERALNMPMSQETATGLERLMKPI